METHRFYLQILGDHCRFIRHRLTADEVQLIQQATRLQQIFDQLLERANAAAGGNNLVAGSNNLVAGSNNSVADGIATTGITDANAASDATVELIELKETIRNRLVTTGIGISLSPEWFTDTIHEAESYLLFLEQGDVAVSLLESHKLWLHDAAGHCQFICDNLDGSEKVLKKKYAKMSSHLMRLYGVAFELQQYLSSIPDNQNQNMVIPASGTITYESRDIVQWPKMIQFTDASEHLMSTVTADLLQLRAQLSRRAVLGTLDVLDPDHMIREHAFYIRQIQKIGRERGLVAANAPILQLDPAAARTE